MLEPANDNVTYYCSVESTNAAQSGYAEYSVTLNENSKFFEYGYNDDDDWENARDLGWLDETLTIENDWVGFGDAVDYYSFSVGYGTSVNFDIQAADAAKITVYQLVDGRLKSLQSTTVAAGQSVATQALKLTANGDYYFSIESTNAAKGGNAWYSFNLQRYQEPLKLTIGGFDDNEYDELDDYFYPCYNDECSMNFEYHLENCVPAYFVKNAVYGDIYGSSANDTITFKADRSRFINGNIELGDGNDKLIWEKSANTDMDVSETNFGYLFFHNIDMGAGNDTIHMTKYNELRSIQDIILGSGDDEFIADGGEINVYGEIDFGDGNDKLLLNKDSELNLWYGDNFEFGAGDDSMIIAEGAKCCANELSFGDGDDSLVLNGNLYTNAAEDFDIAGLEELSGNGTLIVYGWVDHGTSDSEAYISDALIEKCEGTGITIVNGLDYPWSFDSIKEARADDTRAGAKTVKDNSPDYEDETDIWLCSQEVADSVEFGFCDTVDYIKIEIPGNSGGEVQIFNYSSFEYVDIELQDKNGNFIRNIAPGADEFFGSFYFNLDRGTYYLKFTVHEGEYFIGAIELDD